MEYHLDREIRLSEETEHKSLYSTFLQEFTKEGKALSPKLIPWSWTLDFRATELEYIRRFETAADKSSESGAEYIRATLKPDSSQKISDRYPPKYSMFGTDRLVKDFSVTIHKLKNEQDEEKCTIWGGVSYTAEVDFRYHTQDDMVCFRVFLRPENYDALCHFAKNGGDRDELFLSVSRVAGFYSEWSPGISTNSIKILATGEEQEVVKPEGHNEKLPRLSEVSEFTLRFTRRTNLNVAAQISEDEDDAEEYDSAASSKPVDVNIALLKLLHKLQTTLAKLRIPIWLIVVLLVLLVLR